MPQPQTTTPIRIGYKTLAMMTDNRSRYHTLRDSIKQIVENIEAGKHQTRGLIAFALRKALDTAERYNQQEESGTKIIHAYK